MKKVYTESICFFLILVFAFLLSVLIFGIEELKTGSVVLNVHDTYLVIDVAHFFIIFLPIIFTLFYFLRNLFNRFRNQISNSLFLIFNLVLILILSSILFNNDNSSLKPNGNLLILVFTLIILEFYVAIRFVKNRVRH